MLDLNLFGKVLPEQCKTSVGVAKLEVRLKKAEDARWGDIVEGSGGASGAVLLTAAKTVAAAPPGRPAYPSSKAAQKKTVTDWDKLERELEKEEEDSWETAIVLHEDVPTSVEDYLRAHEDEHNAISETLASLE